MTSTLRVDEGRRLGGKKGGLIGVPSVFSRLIRARVLTFNG